LKELVSLHGEQGPDQEAGDLLAAGGELGATLTKDEVTIIKGALDLSSKIVKDTMTPIDKVFMLDIKDRLTEQKLDQVPRRPLAHLLSGVLTAGVGGEQILQTGHSRVPVYRGAKTNVVGMIIVKKLIKLNPERATPVSVRHCRA
jgi:CBS domain containing-hemolysin-like protein